MGEALLLAEHAGALAYHASHEDLATVVEHCDAAIFDAPYSDKTHTGHAAGAQTANRAADWAKNYDGQRTAEARYALRGKGERRRITYAPWSDGDVAQFVALWSPRVRGWFVSITDSVLVGAWSRALEAAGRLVFAPLPFVAPGSRVRMTGDGPSCWTCWIVAARPRCEPYSKWGTLPGAYVLPRGAGEGGARRADNDDYIVGGKPLWLMERLVEDYSRSGDLVVDPTMGAGTTLVAAQRLGRRSVGGDVLLEHAQIAARRISAPVQRGIF